MIFANFLAFAMAFPLKKRKNVPENGITCFPGIFYPDFPGVKWQYNIERGKFIVLTDLYLSVDRIL